MAMIGFGLAYLALGVITGFGLHTTDASLPWHFLVLSGVAVFTVLSIVHSLLAFYNRIRNQDLRFIQLRNDLNALAGRLDDGVLPRTVISDDDERYETIVSEMRILQSVIDKIAKDGNRLPATVEKNATPAFEKLNDTEVLRVLRDAVHADRIEVFLQPIVSLPQRKLRYYEMFTRIKTPDGQYLTPDRYLRIAEDNKFITGIDNLQLLRCIQLLRDTERRNNVLRFFCNISSATLRDTGFMTELVQFLGQNANLAPKLIFELAQEDLATMSGDLVPVLDGLGRLGCRFSMDRIYSLDIPLAALQARKIRAIKVDADVLLAEFNRAGGETSLREFKDTMDRNGIDMICSKIESEQQLRELLDLNIDFGQGYLFGEPRANWPLS